MTITTQRYHHHIINNIHWFSLQTEDRKSLLYADSVCKRFYRDRTLGSVKFMIQNQEQHS